MKKNNIIYLLIGFFIVFSSIILRWNQIIFPTLINHEWNYSTVIRTLDIWEKDGGLKYFFNPVMTYGGEGNLYIDNNASNEKGRLFYEDINGKNYYTSYPQFGYIAPYITFKLLNINPGLIPLRVFNLITQILISLILFQILYAFTRKKWVGMIGFASYMFFPITMYGHTNNYMSDIFMQLFFALNILILQKIIYRSARKIYLLLYFISLFMLVYTDWFGLFFGFGVFVYSIVQRKMPYGRFLLYSSIIAPLLAVMLSVFQYSFTLDLSSYIQITADRYLNSYGHFSLLSFQKYFLLLKYYFYWYKPVLIIFAILLLIIYKIGNIKKVILNAYFREIFFFSILPVILHNIFFLNWTVFHSITFSTLKMSIPVSLAISLLFASIPEILEKSKFSKIKLLIFGMGIFCLGWSVLLYWNSRYVPSPDFSTSFCQSGNVIKDNSEEGEVAFLKDAKSPIHHFPINPVIVYCAKRNIAIYENFYQAKSLMEKNNAEKGAIFTITYFDDGSGYVTKKEIINLSKKEIFEVSSIKN